MTRPRAKNMHVPGRSWRTCGESRSGVVSTQVLQELAVNLRRKAKRPLDAKATRDVVTDYLAWQVVVNGGDSILEALDLEARYQISFWDALVIQAAQVAGAEDGLYPRICLTLGANQGPCCDDVRTESGARQAYSAALTLAARQRSARSASLACVNPCVIY